MPQTLMPKKLNLNGSMKTGAVAEKMINPMSKEQWLRKCRRAERSFSMFKVRMGGPEETPLIKGKGSGCALLEQL